MNCTAACCTLLSSLLVPVPASCAGIGRRCRATACKVANSSGAMLSGMSSAPGWGLIPGWGCFLFPGTRRVWRSWSYGSCLCGRNARCLRSGRAALPAVSSFGARVRCTSTPLAWLLSLIGIFRICSPRIPLIVNRGLLKTRNESTKLEFVGQLASQASGIYSPRQWATYP